MESVLGDSTVAERYRRWAAREAAESSPQYERWASSVAEDSEVTALLESLPVIKQQPNLVFAAARWHGADRTYTSFRRTVIDRWPEVSATILARSTQTNEAGRCAVLLPYLAELEGPLALLEIGASAGLCLFPDRYSYRYSDGTQVDPDDGPSDVEIHCDVSGSVPMPQTMPEVAWRAGLDLNPVDGTDPDQAAWLETLIWPEHQQRRRRLRGALRVASARPPRLVRGDLVSDLERLVEVAPSEATLVIFHSAVLAYVDEEDRKRFSSLVHTMPGHWISNEGPDIIRYSTLQDEAPKGSFVLGVDGEPRAFTQPHGEGLIGFEDSDSLTRSA